MSPKNHCNFLIETAIFEHRHENKSCSACPKEQTWQLWKLYRFPALVWLSDIFFGESLKKRRSQHKNRHTIALMPWSIGILKLEHYFRRDCIFCHGPDVTGEDWWQFPRFTSTRVGRIHAKKYSIFTIVCLLVQKFWNSFYGESDCLTFWLSYVDVTPPPF